VWPLWKLVAKMWICAGDVPESSLSIQGHKPFESESYKIFSSHDVVESSQSHKNYQVTSSHWFASTSQCWIKWNSTFSHVLFCCEMAPKCYVWWLAAWALRVCALIGCAPVICTSYWPMFDAAFSVVRHVACFASRVLTVLFLFRFLLVLLKK